jgi:uncharacterized protein YceH (UPF0502 family)
MDLEGNKSRRLMRKAVNAETARLAGCIVRGKQKTPQNTTVSIRLPTAAGAQSETYTSGCNLAARSLS